MILVAQSGRPLATPLAFPLWNVDEVSLTRSATRDTGARLERDQLLVELADGWMSSPHARLVREPTGHWRLHDLGSKNGSYVNGALVFPPGPASERFFTSYFSESRYSSEPGRTGTFSYHSKPE